MDMNRHLASLGNFVVQVNLVCVSPKLQNIVVLHNMLHLLPEQEADGVVQHALRTSIEGKTGNHVAFDSQHRLVLGNGIHFNQQTAWNGLCSKQNMETLRRDASLSI